MKINAHLAVVMLLSIQFLRSALVMLISLEIKIILMNAHPAMKLATAV